MLDSPSQRAARAEQILSDPLVVEAFAAIESSIMDGMVNCPLANAAQLQSWAALLQASKAFKGKFTNMVMISQLDNEPVIEEKSPPRWYERYSRKSA
jgi:hypothetical protein